VNWTESSEDEVLMNAYQLGDLPAFEVLYRRYSRRVYGYLRQKVGPSSIADDLFQSTFMKLHQSRNRYNPSYPFQPWLFTICRNVVLDHWRQTQQSLIDVNSDKVEQAAATPQTLVTWPDLSSLSPQQRQALELRFREGFSFDEMSKVLGTSHANARQLVSRAIRKFKNVFQKKGSSP